MRKLDVNGNTVSTSAPYLRRVIRNMAAGTYEVDSAGLVMVNTVDGGHIRFYVESEPVLMRHVVTWLSTEGRGIPCPSN